MERKNVSDQSEELMKYERAEEEQLAVETLNNSTTKRKKLFET